MSAGKPIRILHLEDCRRDAEWIQDKLDDAGLVCEIVHVDNREKFEGIVSWDCFDLILCDYAIPGYDGFAAMQLARRAQPEVPVIFVSGTLGEEEAVLCLQMGATDYLLKHRLERFVSAVERALQNAGEKRKRRAAEAALRESQFHLRAVLDSAHEAIISTNGDGTIFSWNKAAERIFGYASEEVTGKSVQRLLPDQSLPTLDEMFRRLGTEKLAHDQAKVVRLRGVRRDGSEFPMELSLGSWKTSKGQFHSIILRDITERMEAEEAQTVGLTSG
jgi:PAS domain S-box-containing protein